jgi:hypothetical protein
MEVFDEDLPALEPITFVEDVVGQDKEETEGEVVAITPLSLV